jgi:hypothetical protein
VLAYATQLSSRVTCVVSTCVTRGLLTCQAVRVVVMAHTPAGFSSSISQATLTLLVVLV